jgi:hypothetical protein
VDPGTDNSSRIYVLEKRKISGIFRKTMTLEFLRRAFGFSSGILSRRDSALWKVRLPPKRKKKRWVEREPVL